MSASPMDALLEHLSSHPRAPIPEDLRAALLGHLRRTRTQRDRILRELAAYLDPDGRMNRWAAAKQLAAAIAGFERKDRLRSGRRAPATHTEELLLQAYRCNCGLPTSPRALWDVLQPPVQKHSGLMFINPTTKGTTER